MKRWLIFGLLILSAAGLSLTVTTAHIAHAQTQLRQGDSPVAALISVSLPDENGLVTISGAAGAVFPNAQVAIRNLYTEETVYTNAGITGTFSQRLYGPGTTPFWVSVAPTIPQELRNRPGSLPGGPGTIIYGTAPEIGIPANSIVSLLIDGSLDDWEAYDADSVLARDLRGLRSADSFYIALEDHSVSLDFAQIRVDLAIDGATYTATIDRVNLRSANVEQTAPSRRNRGAFAINAAVVDDILELRIPTRIVDSAFERASLSQITLFSESGGEVETFTYEDATLELVNQRDGAVYAVPRLNNDAVNFYVAGAAGIGFWEASGRANTLTPAPGDEWILELDVRLFAPDVPLFDDPTFTVIGELGLQPTFTTAANAGNGWANVLTPSGLPIDNLKGDVFLGRTTVTWNTITRRNDAFVFGLRFAVTIPDDLPQGVYTPYLRGFIQQADRQIDWADFNAGENPIPRQALRRLPVTLNIGEVASQRLYWSLFYDIPSEGSRGVLAERDRENVALSNRVRFNSPTYILPPGVYPVEPYIPNIMPNAYDSNAAPLIPFLFPGGRLTGEVTRPDGTRESLGSVAVVQNWLSTPTLDERLRFGTRNPVDMYRLTTLNPLFTAYNFSAYGEYAVNLTGTIDDALGNRYEGGGVYRVTIAEPLDLAAGVLSGTPFEVGDMFYAGARLTPGLPAEVTVSLRVYPLAGGDVITETWNGVANEYGYFTPDSAYTFSIPGEYVVDYEARYTDADGRLWAASQRGAGVIANPDGRLIARGQRGLVDFNPADPDIARPAWFNIREYPPEESDVDVLPRLYYPYHAGDVAVYADSVNSGIFPIIQVQDLQGDYAGWLRDTLPGYVSPLGQTIEEAIRQDSLPLMMILGGPPDSPYQPALLPAFTVNQAYAYISAVRPAVSVRQLVQGDSDAAFAVGWDGDDPLNGQTGAGTLGVRPGDYTFLFGGAIVRNAEANVLDSAIYAAFAIVGAPEGDPFGVRVYPPYRGEAGGPDAGALVTVRDTAYDAFFHPTAIQPGQVMRLGETLTIAGQVAPTIQSRVEVIVTTPEGERRTFSSLTNAIGYFYDPENDMPLDSVGVWRVRISVTPVGVTSAGIVEPPLPTGGILGAVDDEFLVYVVSPDTAPLSWNRGEDIDTDTPPGGLFNFTMNIPQGWTNVTAYHTVTTPGYILEEGILRNTPSTAGYQYSPPELSRIFPNLEFDGRGDGGAASDVVTITFAVSGTNAEGEPALSTRTFTILHDRILSFEGETE